MKKVYFDNAATTKVHDEVVDAMAEVLKNNYGNPSSTHSFGRSSKVLLEKSRNTIAKHLNAEPGEIIFTSGGTESNNLILQSAVNNLNVTHIITSKIEHHAVLNTVNMLHENYGVKVSYVKLDIRGDIDLTHLETLMQTEAKTLVSLMHINNEIGNVLNLQKVANLCKKNDVLFHSDAVQSVGHYKLNLKEIPIDFIVASAHKFHGPKGVGFAFVRKNSNLKPIIIGGEQERGLRAGTENLHNIVGMETALKMADKNLESTTSYITDLKQYFIEQLQNKIPNVDFNGTSSNLNNNAYTILNVQLPYLAEKSNMILFQLDLKGIACSRGSACQSGSEKKSHVLTEILNETELQKPSLRFSFSKYNTKAEIDYVVEVLKELY
ncbi:cysteine desulfurase family protein [Neotamlana laminarinivorans]|uniref:cysteine desulfurase n=1 Tax=Neotamlana laminarinivorans TaxID=2883124 RepID=A0A9X1L295_9FLAO|nr:cysteine desulfurase family protein [Tamlana laminarinivorans]MCB4797384.1 cysteine desulfurase [Tamlana laminarinivorans]